MITATFARIAQATAVAVGRPTAFIVAVLAVLTWGITGPIFHFSETWQLIINTGTTIITFLMLFLLQHTQARDTAAVHAKLDELIRTQQGARNSLIAIEKDTDQLLQD